MNKMGGSFPAINNALGDTPLLISPYYNTDFIIFPFSFEHIIAAVLIHKNYEGPSLCSLRDKYEVKQRIES